ncbi:MAG: M23 family metallopeptidase [Dehalococcoidia bacterium]|nr:M23 family metallopeptidase [Dehalococcoidia bacterium]
MTGLRPPPHRRLVPLAIATALALLLGACADPRAPLGGGERAAAATVASPRGTAPATPAAATRTPPPALTGTPTPTPTPTPLLLSPPSVIPPLVGQGETLLVRLGGVPAGFVGTLRIGAQEHPMVRADGTLWAVAGVPLDARIGEARATVVVRDTRGAPLGEASATYAVVALERPVDYLELTPETTAILTPEAADREAALRAAQFAAFDAAPRWDRAFRAPLPRTLDITTAFGQGRSINGGPVEGQHSGTDLAEDEGTPVYAAAAGRVSWAGVMPIRGNAVILDHGAGVLTGYHHLHDIAVEAGRAVQAGDLIGHVGATGLATGPHLHWELSIYGVNVDAMTWLTRVFGPSTGP